MATENVLVLGASNNPERYSYKALMRLKEKGHHVYGVHPLADTINGIAVYPSVPKAILAEGQQPDTITLYLAPKHSIHILKDIVDAKPRRVIFNPGTESDVLKKELDKHGIHVQEACSLVLLATNQWAYHKGD